MELFKLLGTIAIENAEAKKALQETSQEGEKTESKLGKAFSAIGKGAAVAGKAIAVGLAAGATAMAGLTAKALSASGDLEQNMGGAEAVFGELGKTIGDMQTPMQVFNAETGKVETQMKSLETVSKEAYKNMGLSQSDYLATANKMGALFKGAGFETQEALDLSSQAMQRAADVASIMGIDTSAAMEAVAGAAKGNFTMMDNLGVAMNDTAIGAYALEKGISKSTSEMSQQEKIGLAMEMFLEKTSYAAGNYAKENETLAGSLGTAKAAFTNFLSGSGDVSSLVSSFSNLANVVVKSLTEIAPRLTQGISDLVQQVAPLIAPLLQTLLPVIVDGAVSLVNGLVAALPSVLDALLASIPALIDGVMQIVDALIGALPGVLQALLAALPTLIPQLIDGIVSAAMMLVEMLPQIIQPIIDNLPTIIISIVEALVNNLPVLIQGLIQLIMGIVTAIPQIIQALVDAIPTIVSLLTEALLMNLPTIILGLIQVVMGIVTALPQIFMSLIQAVPMALAGVWDGITSVFGNIGDYFGNIWNGVTSIFKTAWNGIKGVVSSVVNGILNVIKTVWNTIKNTISNVLDGIKTVISNVWNAIKSVISTVVNGIKTVISDIWNGIKNTISTVLNGIKSVVSSVWNGIKSTVSSVVNGIKSVVTSVWNGIKSAISGAVNGVKTTVTTGFNNVKNVVINTFKNLPSKLISVGTDLVKGLWKGINNATDWVIGKIKGFGDKILKGIKSFFGIASPAKSTIEVGKYLAEGVAVGIEENTAAATTAMEDLGKEVLKVAKQNIAKEKKQAKDLNAEIVKVAKTKLDNYKTYNKLTAKSEAEFWDTIRQQFTEGTEERIEADKMYFEAREKIDSELMDSAEKRLDTYKQYNDMTLAAEVGFWDGIRQQFTEGTDARLDADKKYLEAKKSLDDQVLAAEETLSNSLDEIYQKIADRKKEITESFNLFEEFTAGNEAPKTFVEMKNALDSQIKSLEAYDEEMQKLEQRLGGTSLFEEFSKLGVDSLSQLQEINNLSDYQLQVYIEKYNKREELASKIANDEMADETIKATEEAYKTFATTLEGLGLNVTDSVGGMSESVVTNFETIGQKVGSVLDTLNPKMQAFASSIAQAFETALSLVEELYNPDSDQSPEISIKYSATDEATNVSANVDWHAKSMDNASILKNPTIFGYDNKSGKYLGGGEAGNEVVAGEQTLMNMIQGVVAEQNSTLTIWLQRMFGILSEYFPQMLEAMESPMGFDANAMAGVLAVPMNQALGKLSSRKERGR